MIKDYLKSTKESDWIEYIISNLQGTINDLEYYKEEYIAEGFNEDTLLEELDNSIFLCNCGWWCDISEQSIEYTEEQVCIDCEDDYL